MVQDQGRDARWNGGRKVMLCNKEVNGAMCDVQDSGQELIFGLRGGAPSTEV